MATRAQKRPTREAKRIPVSGNRDVMTVSDRDPNYEYRWVNDNTDGRIDRFKAGGWDFVEKKDHKVGQRDANSSEGATSFVTKMVGKEITAYLMRINKEFYDEDQEAKHSSILDSEEDLKRQLNSGNEGSYGSVKME